MTAFKHLIVGVWIVSYCDASPAIASTGSLLYGRIKYICPPWRRIKAFAFIRRFFLLSFPRFLEEDE